MEETEDNQIKILQKLLYLIVFFVFMGGNFLKFDFLGINFNVGRVFMILPLFVILIDILKNKKIDMNIKTKKIKYCVLFFILWSIYSVITIINSKDIYSYLVTNFYICIGTINICFFTKYIDIKKNKKSIFNIISICVFINCLYYIFLYFIKNQNIGGFYHNSNDLATVLLLAIPISVNLLINNTKKIHVIFQSIILLTYIFSFANILSRACILGVCFAILMLLVLETIKYRKEILASNKLKILVTTLIIVCICLSVYMCMKYIGKINLNPIENPKRSNDIRTNLIHNGIYFLSNGSTFFTGIGSGNIIYFLKNNSIYSTNNIYNFHNFWLDLIVEYGIFIFIGFIIMYFIMCKELYSKNKKEKNIFKKTNIVFLLFLLAFIVASISASTIITREWLWITFGIILSYINKGENVYE